MATARVHLVAADGTRRTLDVKHGENVMRAAVFGNAGGILGECGGLLSCATCHVYVDEAWAARLPNAEPDELAMLEFTAAERRATSRLSCQITMRSQLDGLVLHIPGVQV